MAGLTHKDLQRSNKNCLIYTLRVQNPTLWVSSLFLLSSSQPVALLSAPCRNTSKGRDASTSAWDFPGVKDILCVAELGFPAPWSWRGVGVQKCDLNPSLDGRSDLCVLSQWAANNICRAVLPELPAGVLFARHHTHVYTRDLSCPDKLWDSS